jgi:hypothetical protein
MTLIDHPHIRAAQDPDRQTVDRIGIGPDRAPDVAVVCRHDGAPHMRAFAALARGAASRSRSLSRSWYILHPMTDETESFAAEFYLHWPASRRSRRRHRLPRPPRQASLTQLWCRHIARRLDIVLADIREHAGVLAGLAQLLHGDLIGYQPCLMRHCDGAGYLSAISPISLSQSAATGCEIDLETFGQFDTLALRRSLGRRWSSAPATFFSAAA